MRNKLIATMLLASASLLPTFANAQEKSAIEIKNEAFKEVSVPNSTTKKLVPASSAAPGEPLLYVLTVRNISDKPVSNVVVGNPVPQYTEYKLDSQTSSNAKFEVSVDQGKTFGSLGTLQKTAVNGSKSIAQAKDVTNLRWTLSTALKPKEETKITYRLQLN
ncbi:MAG: hypothetical protein V4607_05365 [Pseudomonadota bacterium]